MRTLRRRRPRTIALSQPVGAVSRIERRLEAGGGPSVVVVGAGFAGLTAAWALALSGCAVTVLEARDRVGGRVYSLTDFTPGRIVEGGAELIGTNHRWWIFFARNFRLALDVVTDEELYAAQWLEEPMFLDGRILSPPEIEQVNRDMETAEKLMNEDAATVPANEPWTAPRAQEWDALSLGDWIAGLDISPLGKAALEATFANNNGEPTSRQSYLANLATVSGGGLKRFWTDSEVFRCSTGNQSLATSLEADIERRGGRVVLSSPVTSITIAADGVTVQAGIGTLTADYVVLAIPPSTWHKLAVSPPIPGNMYMQMGVNVKFLSTVQGRFWLGERLAPSSLADTYGMSWEGTDNQTVVAGQGIEFSVFAGGDAAQRALDAADPARYYAPLIDQVYSEYSGNLVSTRFMAWPREQWTLAGYSSPAPGQVTTIGPFLASPYSGRLFFAGEHTCPAYYGFMEGALESGMMAARRIWTAAGIAVPPGIPMEPDAELT